MRFDPNGGLTSPLPTPMDPTAASTVPAGPAYCNPTRNPYFHIQELQRMENLVTTRSNVYAVWITIGYFEVQKHPSAAFLAKYPNYSASDPNNANLYPDGYELGQEVGLDTGDVKRHKAFYIFDRSIPVGFFRGQDLNFDKGVLIRRFIE
jgi:hypothetical protein